MSSNGLTVVFTERSSLWWKSQQAEQQVESGANKLSQSESQELRIPKDPSICQSGSLLGVGRDGRVKAIEESEYFH